MIDMSLEDFNKYLMKSAIGTPLEESTKRLFEHWQTETDKINEAIKKLEKSSQRL